MRSKKQKITLISEDASIEGELKVSESLVLLGSFKGDIESKTLEIGLNAKVIGSVEAVNINISGHFEGELVCHSLLTITKAATVRGRVAYGTLSIESGGLIEAELFQSESMDTKLIPFYNPKEQSKRK
jgi:cytoskeletal protein CcmA (bactofilin family)